MKFRRKVEVTREWVERRLGTVLWSEDSAALCRSWLAQEEKLRRLGEVAEKVCDVLYAQELDRSERRELAEMLRAELRDQDHAEEPKA